MWLLFVNVVWTCSSSLWKRWNTSLQFEMCRNKWYNCWGAKAYSLWCERNRLLYWLLRIVDTYSGIDAIVTYYIVYSIFIVMYIIYRYICQVRERVKWSTRTTSDVEGIPQMICTSFLPISISIIIKHCSHRAPFNVITFTRITFDKLPKHKHARGNTSSFTCLG